jgi:uncharacterized membrane protein YsdA (DUF1294 family)
METIFLILVTVFLIINIFSFFLMLDDKARSRKNNRRVSEGSLLFCAICFGALGIFVGMFVARHKTLKLMFIVGVPLALAQNLLVIYFLYLNLSKIFIE